MRGSFSLAPLCLLLAAATGVSGADNPQATVLSAMQAEMERSMQKLKAQPVPPYFLSYEITDTTQHFAIASFGKLGNSGENHQRQLDIDLRVGDYKMDNTREIRGGGQNNPYANFQGTVVPIDNDPEALRGVLWYHTDERYKRALEQFTKVKTNVQVKVEQEDKSVDFSHEEGKQYSEPPLEIKFDQKLWEDKVRKYTAPFAQYAKIYSAQAFIIAGVETRWFVNHCCPN